MRYLLTCRLNCTIAKYFKPAQKQDTTQYNTKQVKKIGKLNKEIRNKYSHIKKIATCLKCWHKTLNPERISTVIIECCGLYRVLFYRRDEVPIDIDVFGHTLSSKKKNVADREVLQVAGKWLKFLKLHRKTSNARNIQN